MNTTPDSPLLTRAPWTPAQVANLHRYQFGPHPKVKLMGMDVTARFHPFTCGNRDDGKHHDNGGDLGILIPTVSGWICQYCDYKQDWAYPAMCEPHQ